MIYYVVNEDITFMFFFHILGKFFIFNIKKYNLEYKSVLPVAKIFILIQQVESCMNVDSWKCGNNIDEWVKRQ
jgi:hypothetical protein